MKKLFLLIAFGLASLTPKSEGLAPCNFITVDLRKDDGNCSQIIHKPSPYRLRGIVTVCPRTLDVFWLNRPPFVFTDDALAGNKTHPIGVFVDAVRSSLSVCCRREGSSPPNIIFDRLPTKSLDALHSKVLSYKNSESYMILPVVTDVKDNQKYLDVVDVVSVLQSPGEILLLRRESVERNEQFKVWQSIESVWLAISLSILLSAIAGVCVWALDTLRNPDDFPNSFGKGASEGFWWAFVTMTTVGYGDRTPKSMFGRLFGIIWIVFGISLCSIMTATITTALTSMNVKKDVAIMDKKIAVLAGSNSISEAVKNFAIPKVYEDLKAMDDALAKEEVDGIMVEMSLGVYNLHSPSFAHLQIQDVYKSLHSYGFAFWKFTNGHLQSPFSRNVNNCLKNIFRYREKDVAQLVDDYLDRSENNKLQYKEMVSFFSLKSPLFKKIFIILSALTAMIVVCGFAEQFYRQQCKASSKGQRAVEIKE
ncbi:uncharacterized protein LOC110248867 [Exaiptasia diaphana]|uniref:Potassium channel domain-containing protein n=1 Tax=Exaiptasia diaphana TaxID=2652724 RepID=A0A913XWR0_EXADI|nr:uncharacterized protein LOC110248867 [Exaiptasia diaphana]KXJ08446.1 Voltage-gated potassium channel [Exaiptasia diaphana]